MSPLRLLSGAAACVLTVALFACEAGELKKLAEKHRAEIEQALKVYEPVPALLAQTPRFDKLTALKRPGVLPVLYGKGSNGLVLHAEDLKELGAPGNPPLRLEGDTRDGWTTPDSWAHFARTGEWKGSVLHPNYVETALAELKAQRFALVIRTERFQQAAEAGEDGFVPGRFEGDAVLVDLVDGKVVGGFPLELAGEDTLMVMSRKGPIRGMRLEESVEDASDLHMRRQLAIALAEGLEELVPGATPPYLGSYLRDRPKKPAPKKQ